MRSPYISSATPFDLSLRLRFDSASPTCNQISISSNDKSINAAIKSISQVLLANFYMQTNINELIWHGMQRVTKIVETEKKFNMNLEPPIFLNSAEEIRETVGDDLFKKIKSIVDDQIKNREAYFARLRELD